MSQHMQRAMEEVEHKAVTLGTAVEEAIARAFQALTGRDAALAGSVIDHDSVIDRMEVEVEEECLKFMALYQPVAGNLRRVVALLKMNNDLERIGDLAVNIAKRARTLAQAPPTNLPPELREMAQRASGMVKAALDSLVAADAERANAVLAEDDRVDDLRRQITRRVEEQIRQSPGEREGLAAVANAARHLERIADMATNIAEDVIYMVRGEIVRHRHGLDEPR